MTNHKDHPTLNVRVPADLKAQVDNTYDRRGFSNRSEFIRSAIRDALDAPRDLSQDAQDDIETSRKQFETGDTASFEDVLEDADVDSAPEPVTELNQIQRDPMNIDAIGIWDDAEPSQLETQRTEVKIVGCGTAGSQLIGWLDKLDSDNRFETIAVDTDKMALNASNADTKVLLKPPADSDSEIEGARNAARAAKSQLHEILDPADIVLVLTGFGGVTGTGTTPVVASAARDSDTTVMSIATLPHRLEPVRRQRALQHIDELRDSVDTFALLDPIKFDDYTPTDSVGRVFDEINRYIVGVIQQLISRIDDFNMIQWDASMKAFLDDGGFATLISGSMTQGQSADNLTEELFTKSLVNIGEDPFERADRAILLFQGGTGIEENDVTEFVHTFATHAEHIAWTFTRNRDLNEDSLRVTGIVTGLTFVRDELLVEPADDTQIEDAEAFEFVNDGVPA